MRKLILVLSICTWFNLAESQSKSTKEDIPFYDHEGMVLSSEATIVDYDQKTDQLQITGVVYESDGVTPAKDVVIYLYQHDENGEFQFEEENGKKRLRHRMWIKTDDKGRYTFNTFMPGQAIIPLNYPRRYGPKQIYLVAKTNESKDFNLPAFMFEGDDRLSKSCIKRLKRKGVDCILSPQNENGKMVARKNITL